MGSGFIVYSLAALLMFSSVVMILLVLIQRGRGGGLAGAFGGMGGQSALGVRAGDVFTRITIVVAIVWVSVAGLLGISMRARAEAQKNDTIFPGAEVPGADATGAGDAEVPETLKVEELPDTPEVMKSDSAAPEPAKSEGAADAAPATPVEKDDAADKKEEPKPEPDAAKAEAKPAADSQEKVEPVKAETSTEKAAPAEAKPAEAKPADKEAVPEKATEPSAEAKPEGDAAPK